MMENVTSAGPSEVVADTKARAVRAITDFLVEMRADGQGRADRGAKSGEAGTGRGAQYQSQNRPHAARPAGPCEALAAAMIMDEQQKLYMGKLRVGHAAVFMTGFEKATFMRVPDFKDGRSFEEHLPDAAVANHMDGYRQAAQVHFLPFDGCRFCGEPV